MADAGGAVTVAYCHSNEVAHSWHQSLLDLVGYDLDHDGRVIAGGWLGMKCGTNGLVQGRNEAVARFLAERDSEWLFWVDTDMGFAPDTVEKLVAAADPQKRPIVGGLCFAQRETTPDGLGGYRTAPRPTIFDWVTKHDGTKGFLGRSTYPVNALVQCSGTGAACILIHRTVLERMGQQFGTWYDRLPNTDEGPGALFGEDLSFCIRAGAIGVPIFVHTGVRTSHLKQQWLQEADFWVAAQVPPATDPVEILVPVLGRPQNAAPFMASLRASTSLASVHVLVSDGDVETFEAWQACEIGNSWGEPVRDLEVSYCGSRQTFAEKVNFGSDGDAPWVFITGDDVRFHPGWLDHAQATAGERFHVVGTNDLGNPRVMAGEHATHLLIRRSYVEEVGASWDGPGVVAHEGYGHWFVDDEVVTAAKQRGVWAMALGSRVEHLHPLFGKGQDDETYRLGQAAAQADAKLFRERLAEHAPEFSEAYR